MSGDPECGPAAEERALLAGLRRGDAAAAERLVRRYAGRMLATARRLLRDDEEARDCVQEAFASAFEGIGGFRAEAVLGTWLHRITVNAALARLRARRRHPECPLDDAEATFDRYGCRREDDHGSSPGLEDVVASTEVRALVRAALHELPEAYRIVIVLRDIEGLDTAETARALGDSAGAVKIRLHRARAALKRILEARLAGSTPEWDPDR